MCFSIIVYAHFNLSDKKVYPTQLCSYILFFLNWWICFRRRYERDLGSSRSFPQINVKIFLGYFSRFAGIVTWPWNNKELRKIERSKHFRIDTRDALFRVGSLQQPFHNKVLSCKAQNFMIDLPMNSPDGHELDCHIRQNVAFLGKTDSETERDCA